MYNEVTSVGQKYGIRNAGYYALRSLRIEKFFAFWGQDLDSFTTPLECGREFRVKFDKVCVMFTIYCVSLMTAPQRVTEHSRISHLFDETSAKHPDCNSLATSSTCRLNMKHVNPTTLS